MDKQKYNNYPLAISQILGLIEANDIAIPEIQRPFVWRRSQVRDLMKDSILSAIGLSLLRLSTAGSQEKEKIALALIRNTE